MWLPSQVEPKHRTRACLVWVVLVTLLIGYTSWVVLSAVQKRDHPSVSLVIQDEPYEFPDISICFYEGHGCDQEDTHQCATSTLEYDIPHFADAYLGFVEGTEDIYGTLNPDFYNCLDFHLSEFKVNKTAFIELNVPTIFLKLHWNVAMDQLYTEIASDSVAVYMYDSKVGMTSGTPFVFLPYNRISSSTPLDLVKVTEMAISMIQTNRLTGEKERNYKVPAMSQTEYHIHAEENKWVAIFEDSYDGVLLVYIRQPAFSFTVLDEIEPVQVETIIGSVGGAWEILVVMWGIMFILNRREGPTHKGRNFMKSVLRGKEAVVQQTIWISESLAHRRSSVTSAASAKNDERPAWDRKSIITRHPQTAFSNIHHRSSGQQPRNPLCNHNSGAPQNNGGSGNRTESSLEPSRSTPVILDIPSVARRPLAVQG